MQLHSHALNLLPIMLAIVPGTFILMARPEAAIQDAVVRRGMTDVVLLSEL